MQYVVRYNLKTGKAAEYRQWLLDNADNFSRGDRQGWRYLDTHFTVMGFGDYDCETRWQVDDYAALGSPMTETGQDLQGVARVHRYRPHGPGGAVEKRGRGGGARRVIAVACGIPWNSGLEGVLKC